MYCLSTFCSVCLEGGKELQGLNSVDIDDIPILNKLIFVCFGHEPIDINTLKFICKSCLEILRTSYQFKRMSLLNNDLLRGYIAQLKYFTGTKGSYGDTVVSLIRVEDDSLDDDTSDVNENTAAGSSKVETVNKREPDKFQCKVCGLKFGKSILRLLHFNKYHNKQKKSTARYLMLKGKNGYSCQYCSKIISTKSRHFQHLIIHKEVNNITCDYCPMVCHMKQGYEEHVCVDHGVEINKFCSICNKVVPDYISHMSEHITPRIKCPYCTKVFFTERTCIYHVNIDHWKYQCSLCDKHCFSESSVSEHIKLHNATIEIMKPLPAAENQTQMIDFKTLLHDQSEILIEWINTTRTYKKPGPKSKTLNQAKTAPKKRKKSEIGYKNKPGPKSKKIMESQNSHVRKKMKLMGPKSRRAKITANENIAQQVEQAKIEEKIPDITGYPAPKSYQTKMDQYIHESNLNWQTKRVHTKKHLKRESQVKCTHCLITFASNKSLITHKCFSSNTYQCPKCKVVYLARKSFRKHMIKCLKQKLNPSSSKNLTIPQTTQDMPINSMQSDNSLGTNEIVVKEELFSEDSVKVEVGDGSDTPVLLNPFSQFVSNENEQATDVTVIEDNYNSGAKPPTSNLEAAVSGDSIDSLIADEEDPIAVDAACENVEPNETNLEKNTEDQQNSLIPPNEDVTLIQVEKPRENIVDLSSKNVPEIRIKMEFPNCDAPDSTVPEVVDSSPSSSVDQPASDYISPRQNKEPLPANSNTVINNKILPRDNNILHDALSSNSSEAQIVEQENANLSCNMCEAKFPTVALLTSHLLVHTYQTSMKCISCKKVFLTQYDLDRHIMLTYLTGCEK